jgi:archaellum component FlaC
MPTTLEGAIIFIAVSAVVASLTFINKLSTDNRLDRQEERKNIEKIADAVTAATNEFKTASVKMLDEHKEDREVYQDSMAELQREISAGFASMKTEMAGVKDALRESRRLQGGGG